MDELTAADWTAIANALHVAAEGGFVDIASHLIAAGALVAVRDNNDKRPRDLAIGAGNYKIVRMLDPLTKHRETEL